MEVNLVVRYSFVRSLKKREFSLWDIYKFPALFHQSIWQRKDPMYRVMGMILGLL